MNDLTFRKCTLEDLKEIQLLFKNTILSVNNRHYSSYEIHAWAKGSENIDKWKKRIDTHYYLLAQRNQKLVGMASSLENYLDVMYIDANHQGKGIASRLLDYMEKHAKSMGHKNMYSDVSITAKPFFLSKGYVVIKPQLVYCRGIYLRNYHVVKTLN